MENNQMLTYDECFSRLIDHEGKLSLDPKDRGNWTAGEIGKGQLRGTKYGISAMAYPHLNISALKLDTAKEIYFQDYWLKMKCDQLHPALAYQMFDSAVNHGRGNATRFLQRAVGALDDGDIGPATLKAISKQKLAMTLAYFNCERLEFMAQIKTFNTYGRGWIRRVSANIRMSVQDFNRNGGVK